MKKSSRIIAGFVALMLGALSLNSCGGSATKTEGENKNVDDATFYSTQPVRSGLYDADYYDITGNNPRKGHFDGRIYFSLSPDFSAIHVFENGNRTKISQTLVLDHPFEKGDSGIYLSVDKNNLPVTINTDSTSYVLGFQTKSSEYKITFNPKPRHEGSAVEILEKINAQSKK